MQEIGIESSVLQDILDGSKTIEGRLGKVKFLKLRVGDKVSLREDIWQNGEIVESVPGQGIILIRQLLYFETFEEMLSSIDFQEIIPRAQNVNEVLAEYRKYYSPEDEKEYGVVAITFSLE